MQHDKYIYANWQMLDTYKVEGYVVTLLAMGKNMMAKVANNQLELIKMFYPFSELYHYRGQIKFVRITTSWCPNVQTYSLLFGI